MNRFKSLLRSWLLAFLLPRPIIGIFYLPRYFADWRRYRALETRMAVDFADSYPCLTDRVAHTPFDPHYFFQGAWLARAVHEAGSMKHVDIGSSVMSIAVLSGFVDTVFVDYRPLKANLGGFASVAGDILHLPLRQGSVESLSCLHVIEHIGLGRYGDPIDVNGSRKAAGELASLLAPGGRLYLSLPVGRSRVCFNAHRVHSPGEVVAMFPSLELQSFSCVDDAGRYHDAVDIEYAATEEYACGMFVFGKWEET
ncbi:MAG TPA: DUF268 domain-containing protein [Mariprofundaceae bacterium]|nr:DUF268 domain-containing protein [Mariprofundaceae bacterium]